MAKPYEDIAKRHKMMYPFLGDHNIKDHHLGVLCFISHIFHIYQ